jgi:hypothetical protein
MDRSREFEYVLKHTKVLRSPKHDLATFGTTKLHYHLLSRLETRKTRVREGEISSERPKILVPQELDRIFLGFGKEAKEYARMLFHKFGSDLRMLEYRFKNRLKRSQLKKEPLVIVYRRLEERLDRSKESFSAIIEGVDRPWQVSLMKFIVEITLKSFYSNIAELEERGFFPDRSGVSERAREEIELLFREAERDKSKIKQLGKRLSELGLFEEYEDRFFALLKRKG